MNIIDLLDQKLVILDLKSKTKNDTIAEMAYLLKEQNVISDLDLFINDIKKREEQTTTGIGDGLAIPHAKSKAVKKTAIVLARSSGGVDYKSLDNRPVNLLFMLAVEENATDSHIEVLSSLSKLLLNDGFTGELRKATSSSEIIEIATKYGSGNQVKDSTSAGKSKSKYYIVAVTACPTGIAHTYMAAEALHKAAQELKIDIKVETNGTSGVDNKLSNEDIEKATGVILAINKTVETNRFKGKQLIQVGASEAIKDAKELIFSIIRNKGEIYQGNKNEDSSVSNSSGEQKTEAYKHLLSGVSYMLPFVVSGGILIALAFLFDRLAGVVAGPDLGSTTYLAKLLKDVGGVAFGLFVPILAAFTAFSIGNRAALTSGFVGGAIAMAGGSGFLGAIVAGFLAGYTTIFLIKLLKNTPKGIEGIKNILILPVLTVLISGAIVALLLNDPIKYINDSILHWLNTMGDANRIVLGVIVGAMMAADMGGPINKAAYVFGIASLGNGDSTTMAAVMAGGMTPPLGIALATTIFKNKFSAEEKEAGKSNYIMGLSFITEGAIPFAAANPLRVIPTLMLGSAVGAGLSMAFGVTLPAPHGGLIVMFLSNHFLLYALSIIVGSLTTAAALGVTKKPIK